MDYKTAIDYLFSLEFFGIKLGLANITKLLELCGQPQHQRCIQIAGTNGKGSVAAMLEAILMTAGKKTGLFTSPHLVDFSERIRRNQKTIPREAVARLIEYLQPKIREIAAAPGLAHPTFFEVNLALALLYFHQEKTDWAILEVGMGGRLDATSAVTPEVVVITNVSLEHTEYLGSSLAKIAFEKAGTIKKGVPVFTTATGVPLKIISETCRKRKAPCVHGEKLGRVISCRPVENGQLITIETIKRRYDDLFLPLQGVFQAENALLAVAVAEYLENVSTSQIREGLAATYWPGRFMTIGAKPVTILDGAHNVAALENLKETLKEYFPQKNLIWVLAVLKDKNLEGILRSVLSGEIKVVVTQVNNTARQLVAAELAAQVRSRGYSPVIKKSPLEAVKYARSIAFADDLVVICGSLYLVGEILSQKTYSSQFLNQEEKNEVFY